jgi:hypothetical protein
MTQIESIELPTIAKSIIKTAIIGLTPHPSLGLARRGGNGSEILHFIFQFSREYRGGIAWLKQISNLRRRSFRLQHNARGAHMLNHLPASLKLLIADSTALVNPIA